MVTVNNLLKDEPQFLLQSRGFSSIQPYIILTDCSPKSQVSLGKGRIRVWTQLQSITDLIDRDKHPFTQGQFSLAFLYLSEDLTFDFMLPTVTKA